MAGFLNMQVQSEILSINIESHALADIGLLDLYNLHVLAFDCFATDGVPVILLDDNLLLNNARSCGAVHFQNRRMQ